MFGSTVYMPEERAIHTCLALGITCLNARLLARPAPG